MALTEVQLAKLIIEIDRLESKAESLKNEARADDAMFFSAALTYGSELAGSSGTKYLYDEAKELEQKADFLRSVRNNITYLRNGKVLQFYLEGVDKELSRLADLKSDLQSRLKNFEYLRQILSR